MKNINLDKWQNKMENYINKCSKHLFIDESYRMYKVIPFNHNGELKYATIKFGEGHFFMVIRKCEATSTQSLFWTKVGIFPQWEKFTAIPNYKRMKEISGKIKDYLEKEYENGEPNISKIRVDVQKMVENEIFFKKDLTNE